MVLIFALIFMRFGRYLLEMITSHIRNMFYVHEKCKISDF